MIARGVATEGVDLALTAHQRSSPHYHCADLRQTGLPTGAFDRILSSYSVFYYANSAELITAALLEIRRLLAPDGYALIVGVHHRTTQALRTLLNATELILVEESGHRVYLLAPGPT